MLNVPRFMERDRQAGRGNRVCSCPNLLTKGDEPPSLWAFDRDDLSSMFARQEVNCAKPPGGGTPNEMHPESTET